MTEKEYYSEKRVSSSSLKWFEKSPLLYRKMLDKEIEYAKKRYLEIGKKIHMKLLEPNEFTKNYIYLDYEIPGTENQRQFAEDYITNRNKDKSIRLIESYKKNYSADKLSDEKILEKAEELQKKLSKYITYLKKRSEVKDVVTSTDNKLINDAETTVKSHDAAKSLLFITDEDRMNNIEEYNEKVIFFKFLDIECKSMLDRIVVDHKNKIVKLIDIKTTIDAGNFEHSFDEFQYYRQMAFYWLAIASWFRDELNLNLMDYKLETYIVAIQKGELCECRVFKIQQDSLGRGLTEIETILPLIKWHQDNNLWEHRKEYYENKGIEKL
jgi:hypothetical protein